MDTLPSMMNALRMVWVISRHYNTDDQMLPLMRRIANEIAEKVAGEVNIKTIFRRDPQEATGVISEAKRVLDSWHSTYLEVREKIEQNLTDHRWEFDKKVLFDKTDYMSEICSNLLEVTTVVDEFNKFFLGSELKVITNDPQRIHEITKMVSRLTRQMQVIVATTVWCSGRSVVTTECVVLVHADPGVQRVRPQGPEQVGPRDEHVPRQGR